MDEILNEIHAETAELIGQGEWVKDGAYRVYKVKDKYYSILICNPMNLEILDDTLAEIKETDINLYI